eukprot:1052968-Prymnesium_polylepis.2
MRFVIGSRRARPDEGAGLKVARRAPIVPRLARGSDCSRVAEAGQELAQRVDATDEGAFALTIASSGG